MSRIGELEFQPAGPPGRQVVDPGDERPENQSGEAVEKRQRNGHGQRPSRDRDSSPISSGMEEIRGQGEKRNEDAEEGIHEGEQLSCLPGSDSCQALGHWILLSIGPVS